MLAVHIVTGIAAAATIVVDQAGGGDVLSLTDAIELARDGDTISLEPGIYYESGWDARGVDNLTLEGAGPELTIISGEDHEDYWVGSVSGNITIRGIRFEADAAGKQWGLFYKSDGGDITDVAVITDCSFVGYREFAVNVSGVFEVLYITHTSFIEQYGTVLVTGTWSSGPVHVESSVFYGSTGGASIVFGADTWDYAEVTHRVVGNTFVNNYGAVSRVSLGGEASVVFSGNVVASGSFGFYVADDRPGDAFHYNVYSDLSGDFEEYPKATDSDYNVESDPQFCIRSEEFGFDELDLRPAPGSPLIDFVAADVGAVVGSDYAGVGRPLDGDTDGEAWADAGAFEFDPTDHCAGEPIDTGDTGPDSPTDSPVDSREDSAVTESQGDSPADDSAVDTASPTEPEPDCDRGCGGSVALVFIGGVLAVVRRQGWS